MAYIVDRRLNGKNKSAVNRQRFLRRYKEHIKRAVAESVNKRSITDLERGDKITIPKKNISEPVFGHGKGGKRTHIHPGNKEFVSGDKVPRPEQGGGRGGRASDSGEGMDDFTFQITQEEFLDFVFEDLELPNLVKKQLKDIESFKYARAGFTSEGTPANINIVRSLRSACARRLALSGNARKQIEELERELALQQEAENPDDVRIALLTKEIERLKNRIKRIPFIDTFDLRYNLHIKQPVPSTCAVMFCLMDVSGSMTQDMKDIAKRFFILLYLFIKRNYERIEVVFIRHHSSAMEVSEEEFFYSRESGGTVVSSALKLMQQIVDARYPSADWNIYAAQASDGDNWGDDSSLCGELLTVQIMPKIQYYAYIEISPDRHQDLWESYEQVAKEFAGRFAMRQIVEASDIYPVFRDLFQKNQGAIS